MSSAPPAVVVDASVWGSLFVPQDLHHEPSRRWLREHSAAGNATVAPIILLTEIAAIARRTGDSALAWQSVQAVLLAATIAANERLRGADTLYLAVAQRLNIPLVSWEQEQIARSVSAIATYTPQDLL